jgi:hypothetical protein
MEMERKDKSKSIAMDKLLIGTGSPFTRQVAYYVYLRSLRYLRS